MRLSHLTSLDLWLDYAPGTVVETDRIEDVACGMYTCFYTVYGGRLKVSTSVLSLIKDKGKLELNEQFQPDFVRHPWPAFTQCDWYRQGLTLDKRVARLLPFDLVSASERKNTFRREVTVKDKNEIIEKVARHTSRFIHDIERKFPGYQHVVLTGGQDSQLIHTVPKNNPGNWHVFSSEPNAPLVKRWLTENGIAFGRFFTHDNRNDEDRAGLLRKIVNADCLSEPDHMKWFNSCRVIADSFSKKCIFWTGNYGELHAPKQTYIRLLLQDHSDFALWRGPTHGIYQKTGFQITGCLFLSAYFSREMWTDLYSKIDYASFDGPCDFREEIGERLAGRKLIWLKENPGPSPWKVRPRVRRKYLEMYVREVRKQLLGNSPRKFFFKSAGNPPQEPAPCLDSWKAPLLDGSRDKTLDESHRRIVSFLAGAAGFRRPFLRMDPQVAGALRGKEDVTVLILIKDRCDYRLENTLASLRAQTYPRDLVKLVLVDYGSARHFVSEYQKLCAQYEAEYLRVDGVLVWNPSHARNIGIKKARTQYLLTSDMDIIYHETYLEKAAAALRADPFQVIVSRLNALPAEAVKGVIDTDRDFPGLLARSQPAYPIACGIQMTLTVFYQIIRGFDERYFIYGKQDKDVLKRFLLMGLRICDRSAGLTHLHQWHERYSGISELVKPYFQINEKLYFSTFSIKRNKSGWGEPPAAEGKQEKKPLNIVISTVYFGGIGGSERRLKSIVESMPENRFHIFAPKTIQDGFVPVTRNYTLNEPLKKGVNYDAYLYFAGLKPAYLGRDYSFRTQMALINGTEKFAGERRFDYAVLSGADGVNCLTGTARIVFALPDVTVTHPKETRKIEGLPERFFLTVFNPYEALKGKALLAEVSSNARLPIVWCYNDMTRSHHLKKNYAGMEPLPNVIQFRNLPQEELHYLYQKASAYVSFSMREGFGWSAADALVYNLPVISRNTGVATFFNRQPGVMTYETPEELRALLARDSFENPRYDLTPFSASSYRRLLDQVLCGV